MARYLAVIINDYEKYKPEFHQSVYISDDEISKRIWAETVYFTAGCSSIDAILTLLLLSELQRQLNRPFYVSFDDLKSVFDSVDRNAVWKALRARGIPNILLNLIEDFHTHTGDTVRIDNKFSHHFSTTSGVRQGCVLAPTLFPMAINWILGHLASLCVYSWKNHFTDLAYADDAAIIYV